MIRPWYRSRLFWLGLPGLLFLLWGWADRGGAPVTVSGGHFRLSIGNSAGTVGILWSRDPGAFAIAGRTGTAATGFDRLFPPAVQQWDLKLSHAAGGGRISVAYWFLLLLYFATWGGLIGYRKRWKQKCQRNFERPLTPSVL